MQNIGKKNIPASIAVSLSVAVIVLFLMEFVERYSSLLGSMVLNSGDQSNWFQYPLIVCIAVGCGLLTEFFGAKRFMPFLAASLIFLMAMSYVFATFFSLRVFFAQCALAVVLAVIFVHVRKLWVIDSELTAKIENLALTGHLLNTNSPEVRIESGLKLLKSLFPLSEVIVFRYNAEDGGLTPVGRTKYDKSNPYALENQPTWQENIQLCEDALASREIAVRVDNKETGSARISLPLLFEDSIIGVLFFKIRQDFEQQDQYLLEAFGEQLARNFQRKLLRGRDMPHKSWWSYFSTQSAETRVDSVTLLDNLMKEQSYSTIASSYLKEAHAIAYLDGSIAYLNRRMRHLVKNDASRIAELGILGLLDNFKTEIFNDPGFALRRVLQSGEKYNCELNFPETNKIYDLHIALVSAPSDKQSIHETNVPMKPACFLITLRDITAKKENAKLRSDMASLMSHELRTPVTSIKGFSELLMMDESITGESREFLGIIASESDRLSKMLTTFLSVSNLQQSDKQEIEKAPVKLDHVVMEVVGEMTDSAKQKRIRLVQQANANLPPVAADKGLITRVVQNLVDNAIKYSPEKTAVIVSTIMEAGFLRVTVEDKGYGIPTEEQDKVWQKFYRVAREGQDKETESTGLGLSFVKEVVEQHGGDVRLESETGQGSKFSFRLPRL